jgi:hypothetical protein
MTWTLFMLVVWKSQAIAVVIPGFVDANSCVIAERETEDIVNVQAWKCYEVKP